MQVAISRAADSVLFEEMSFAGVGDAGQASPFRLRLCGAAAKYSIPPIQPLIDGLANSYRVLSKSVLVIRLVCGVACLLLVGGPFASGILRRYIWITPIHSVYIHQ
jgi:hypothetical protein